MRDLQVRRLVDLGLRKESTVFSQSCVGCWELRAPDEE